MKKLWIRSEILKELIGFLWQQKLWWLIPLVILLVLIGTLLVLTQSSSVAPFIYSLF